MTMSPHTQNNKGIKKGTMRVKSCQHRLLLESPALQFELFLKGLTYFPRPCPCSWWPWGVPVPLSLSPCAAAPSSSAAVAAPCSPAHRHSTALLTPNHCPDTFTKLPSGYVQNTSMKWNKRSKKVHKIKWTRYRRGGGGWLGETGKKVNKIGFNINLTAKASWFFACPDHVWFLAVLCGVYPDY